MLKRWEIKTKLWNIDNENETQKVWEKEEMTWHKTSENYDLADKNWIDTNTANRNSEMWKTQKNKKQKKLTVIVELQSQEGWKKKGTFYTPILHLS